MTKVRKASIGISEVPRYVEHISSGATTPGKTGDSVEIAKKVGCKLGWKYERQISVSSSKRAT